MYALVIGRALPEKETGMMGIFEFEHAAALRNHGYEAVYSFCDTRSIKYLKKYGFINKRKNEVFVYGYHLPIGGIPRRLFKGIKIWHFRKMINGIIKDKGVPDVFHVHFPLLTLTDSMWDYLKLFNRPIIVTEHWSKVQSKELLPHYVGLLKKIVNEAAVFICVGEQLRNSVIELTDTKRDLEVVPNMIKPVFYYEEANAEKIRYEFIAIGRLIEEKRFDLIIKAFAKAFKHNANLHLHIVGDGPVFNQLKRQISDLCMEKRITMHGFLLREETADLIRKSDAFVSASIMETFCVPFIESMACGKPVIGIHEGPIDDHINGENGIQFKKNDLGDLVEALKKMYEKRGAYDGEKISETALSIFSEGAVTKRLDTLYKECLIKNSTVWKTSSEGAVVNVHDYRKEY